MTFSNSHTELKEKVLLQLLDPRPVPLWPLAAFPGLRPALASTFPSYKNLGKEELESRPLASGTQIIWLNESDSLLIFNMSVMSEDHSGGIL